LVCRACRGYLGKFLLRLCMVNLAQLDHLARLELFGLLDGLQTAADSQRGVLVGELQRLL